MKIHELFDIEYPKTLVYSNMQYDPKGINFVSSKGINNSIVSKVKPVDGLKVYPSGVITVPLKGTVMAAHLQAEPCYIAHQVAVLTAKKAMNKSEKLFYCLCIQHNAYRYSYGRQADKTLAELDVPNVIPSWVYRVCPSPIYSNITTQNINEPLPCDKWKEFEIRDLFDVKYGVNLELQNLEITTSDDNDAINFVARTSKNNGVVARVKRISDIPPQSEGIITCAGGGSVLSTFLQNKPFYSGRDLYLLYPKFEMSMFTKLFCCALISANKYRFSYGRQANKSLPSLILKLPICEDGTIDSIFIDNYICSLQYSDRIK